MAQEDTNNEVIDQEPETKGKKGRKGKKPKKEKGAKSKRVKGEKGEKAPKGSKGKLILAIVIIGLIGAAGAFYYFNLFDVKTKVINFFISQDTQYEDAIAAKTNYERLTAELDERQIELNEQQKQLDEDRQKLEDQQAAFRELQNRTNAQGSSTVEGSGGNSVVEVLADMKVSAAAEILNRTMDNGWIADVLIQMDEAQAAKILAAMDVEKAVVITRLMSQ